MASEGRLLVIGFASGEIAKVAMNLPLVKGFSIVGVRAGASMMLHPSFVIDLIFFSLMISLLFIAIRFVVIIFKVFESIDNVIAGSKMRSMRVWSSGGGRVKLKLPMCMKCLMPPKVSTKSNVHFPSLLLAKLWANSLFLFHLLPLCNTTFFEQMLSQSLSHYVHNYSLVMNDIDRLSNHSNAGKSIVVTKNRQHLFKQYFESQSGCEFARSQASSATLHYSPLRSICWRVCFSIFFTVVSNEAKE